MPRLQIKKTSDTQESNRYLRAIERVEEIKGFYGSIISFSIVIPFLIFFNFRYTPEFQWFWFPILGWGIGLIFQGFKAFGYNPFLGRDWEDRKIQEYMRKEDKQYWE